MKCKNIKNILLLLLISVSLHAKIDFSKHIDGRNIVDISLSVTNVEDHDYLNLRERPSSNSKSLYHIPFDAKNLITNDRDILKKIGKNIWVSVRLDFGEGIYYGWVKAKYLKLYEKFKAFTLEDLVVSYPQFLDAEKTKDGWIHISDSIDFEHYSACDERDEPKLLDELSRFDIKLKVYYSLLDAFYDDKSNDLSIYNRITTRGWFKENTKIFVHRVNLHGLRGYRNSVGSSGCGMNTYYFKIDGKILVIKEPFNLNSPIVKGKKSLPKDFKLDDKVEIMRYIIKNLRVF
jgi:hypothetical protein